MEHPEDSLVAAVINQKTKSIDFVMDGKVIHSISYSQVARMFIRGMETQEDGTVLDNYDISRVFKSFAFNNVKTKEHEPESLFPEET